jgi:hypothetical protein
VMVPALFCLFLALTQCCCLATAASVSDVPCDDTAISMAALHPCSSQQLSATTACSSLIARALQLWKQSHKVSGSSQSAQAQLHSALSLRFRACELCGDTNHTAPHAGLAWRTTKAVSAHQTLLKLDLRSHRFWMTEARAQERLTLIASAGAGSSSTSKQQKQQRPKWLEAVAQISSRSCWGATTDSGGGWWTAVYVLYLRQLMKRLLHASASSNSASASSAPSEPSDSELLPPPTAFTDATEEAWAATIRLWPAPCTAALCFPLKERTAIVYPPLPTTTGSEEVIESELTRNDPRYSDAVFAQMWSCVEEQHSQATQLWTLLRDVPLFSGSAAQPQLQLQLSDVLWAVAAVVGFQTGVPAFEKSGGRQPPVLCKSACLPAFLWVLFGTMLMCLGMRCMRVNSKRLVFARFRRSSPRLQAK